MGWLTFLCVVVCLSAPSSNAPARVLIAWSAVFIALIASLTAMSIAGVQ